MPTYTLRVNGRARTLTTWDGNEPLLYALRGSLGLTGAKLGCGLGQCGSCTVLVDDQATRACMVPVSSVAGRRITTVEGLGSPDKPDSLQAAFIAEQAAQCGYCIPGMMIRAHALLRKTLTPSDAQIRQALQPHLCRCGTHMRILRAIRRAAQEMRSASADGPAPRESVL